MSYPFWEAEGYVLVGTPDKVKSSSFQSSFMFIYGKANPQTVYNLPIKSDLSDFGKLFVLKGKGRVRNKRVLYERSAPCTIVK